jgi:hypothetical protein
MLNFKIKKTHMFVSIILSLGTSSAVVAADQGVTFVDVVPSGSSGISYERTPSKSLAGWDEARKSGVFKFSESGDKLPANPHGAPGVSVFDYDRDGDLDIYVTNGPGSPNSLFSSQFEETGDVKFLDVSASAGVGLVEDDSTGSCYGDIDNDGDQDLLVLVAEGKNHLFENLGNGSFNDITYKTDIGTGVFNASSCSMGDVNGDGLLDIAVANSFENWNDRLPLMSHQFAHRRENNQLFLNQGGNGFADISEASGIANFAGISWGIALVDFDQDGDVDLIVGDDQGPKTAAKYGGKDVGLIRIYENDGKAQFTDRTTELGTDYFGAWMGLSFGDLNHDGNLDIFGPNVGEYLAFAVEAVIDFPPKVDEWSSSIFFGNDDGTFERDPTNKLGSTVFGWGSSIIDYDNDGDSDLIYYGGLEMGSYIDGSNPGAILQNDGNGNFTYDALALANSTNHNRRTVKGVAVNDLNQDGFVDIVSVSAENWPEAQPLIPYMPNDFGGVFDDIAKMMPTMFPVNPEDVSEGFIWSGMDPVNGSLAIEMSNADNSNGWAKVNLLGTVGMTSRGKVNRDGIGAIVSFTPKNGKTAIRPIVIGASYASAENIESNFGMGDALKGTLDVLWTGGVRNKLYNVRKNEQVVMPEIPCSYDDTSITHADYGQCVVSSLKEIRNAGKIDLHTSWRLTHSAIKARVMHFINMYK